MSGAADNTDVAVAPEGVERIVARWDDQQAAYITHREERFEIMLDVLAHAMASTEGVDSDGTGFVVVDLACGPGSLSRRVLDRFPGVSVIGVDFDPVLLSIATASLGHAHGSRFTPVDADLTDTMWTTRLPRTPVHAAVSSTALHWLEPGHLVGLYRVLGALLREGGVFLNADHLRFDPIAQPFLTEISRLDDERTQHAAHANGVLTWDEWWAEAIAVPAFGRHLLVREERFADRPPTPHAPLELHLQALRAGGVAEAGTVWRHYNDVVVLGRR